jgi:predicted GNAT family acetyltransferase
MKFERYTDSNIFLNETLEIMLEHEALNMFTINSLKLDIETSRSRYEEIFAEIGRDDDEGILDKLDAIYWSHPKRLFAAIKDSGGSILLTAYCNYPYKRLALFATRNEVNPAAVKLLADELKSIDFSLRRVRAEQGLATCFTLEYGGEFTKHSSVYLMQAEKIIAPTIASGFCRLVEERDLFFVPFWEAECLKDCRQDPVSLENLHKSFIVGLEEKSGYLWEDDYPVCHANVNVKSDNCALIGDVYTPPYYRKKGYATSLVAEISRIILDGKKRCVLLADAENPTSCGIYRKLGYNEMCIVDEIIKEKE